MKDILSTYYDCTLSIFTHNLNVSGHICIDLGEGLCETRAQICLHLSVAQ
jgi:hypothetical protein